MPLYIENLPEPIRIENNWIDRHFYKIKLDSHEHLSPFCIYKTQYSIRFRNLNQYEKDHVKFFRAIKWVFYDFIYNIVNNSVVGRGDLARHINLDSIWLKNSINFQLSNNLNKNSMNSFLNEIVKIVQSNQDVFLISPFTIVFTSSFIRI